jgi:pyruvate/2-oxoglutarate/acetoin dehydrogenase E1 component
VPLDVGRITGSVRRTGALIVVHESPLGGGWAGDVVASVCEALNQGFRVRRITALDSPVPYAPVLEDAVIPGTARIMEEIRGFLG